MLDKKTVDRKIADRKRIIKSLEETLKRMHGKEHMVDVIKEIDKLKSEIKMLESIRVDK